MSAVKTLKTSLSQELADRLRQSVQGCVVHSHGPIQAWGAIEEACIQGEVRAAEVADHALGACRERIEKLLREGVKANDPRVKKEELTLAFMEKLLK